MEAVGPYRVGGAGITTELTALRAERAESLDPRAAAQAAA